MKIFIVNQAFVESTWTCVLCGFVTDVDISSRTSHESTIQHQEALKCARMSQYWRCPGCKRTLNRNGNIDAHLKSIGHLKSVVTLVFPERKGMSLSK